MEDYWQWVDEGVDGTSAKGVKGTGNKYKPGSKDPVRAMEEFIRLRGIVATPPKTLKPRKKPISQEKLRKSLAFAMAKSVKQKGLKPTNFYSSKIEELTDGLTKAIAKGIVDDLK